MLKFAHVFQIMPAIADIVFQGERFQCSSLRTLYHPLTGTLVVSDCHFGKTTHFRKNALPLPEMATNKDFDRLALALNQFAVKHVVFLGDLFHSHENREWQMLSDFLYSYPYLTFTLVKGNHDILPLEAYKRAGITITAAVKINNLYLVHDIDETEALSGPFISGHIHPGYRIKGLGKQQLSLPCFFAGNNNLIMPAFGSLTGLALIDKLSAGDRVYCFTEKQFYPLP